MLPARGSPRAGRHARGQRAGRVADGAPAPLPPWVAAAPDAKVLLLGPRTPLWGCACGESGNFACRTACRGCRRWAPRSILNKAVAEDRRARAAAGQREPPPAPGGTALPAADADGWLPVESKGERRKRRAVVQAAAAAQRPRPPVGEAAAAAGAAAGAPPPAGQPADAGPGREEARREVECIDAARTLLLLREAQAKYDFVVPEAVLARVVDPPRPPEPKPAPPAAALLQRSMWKVQNTEKALAKASSAVGALRDRAAQLQQELDAAEAKKNQLESDLQAARTAFDEAKRAEEAARLGGPRPRASRWDEKPPHIQRLDSLHRLLAEVAADLGEEVDPSVLEAATFVSERAEYEETKAFVMQSAMEAEPAAAPSDGLEGVAEAGASAAPSGWASAVPSVLPSGTATPALATPAGGKGAGKGPPADGQHGPY